MSADAFLQQTKELFETNGVLASSPFVIWRGFAWFDGALSTDGRNAMASWLLDPPGPPGPTQPQNWATAFSGVIDRVFGPSPLSLTFFLRSMLASLVGVLLVSLTLVRLDHVSNMDQWPLVLLLGIANIFPDYLSLVTSRWILRRIGADPQPGRTVRLLTLDLAVKIGTASVAILLIAGGLRAYGEDPNVLVDALNDLGDFYVRLVTDFRPAEEQYLRYEIFFFSSLFTSIWLWMYVIGGAVIKILRGVNSVWRIIAPMLDRSHPLRSIGRVVSGVVTLVYIIYLATSFALRS